MSNIRRDIPYQRGFLRIWSREQPDNQTLTLRQLTLCRQQVYELCHTIQSEYQLLRSKRTLPEWNSGETNKVPTRASTKAAYPRKIKVFLRSRTKPLNLCAHIGNQYEELFARQTGWQLTYVTLHLRWSVPPTQILTRLWILHVCVSERSSGRRSCAQVEPKINTWGEFGVITSTYGISDHGTQPDHMSGLPSISRAAWWLLRNSEAIIR